MSIANIKTAIKTAIEANLTGIKCYTSPPSIIGDLPCCFISESTADNQINLKRSMMLLTLEIPLLLQRVDAQENVIDTVDAYLLPTGSGSMTAAIMAASLTTNANWLNVIGHTGVTSLSYKDIDYLGCKWIVKVMIS